MISLDPRFVAVLHRLCAALDDAPLRWALTGSVGMALQGMPYTPHDVDIQSDLASAYEIERRLAEYVVRPLALKESAGLRSHLGRLEIEGVQVEIIGAIQRPAAAGWVETDIAPITHYVLFDGMRLPVLALGHEAVAYAAMGRPEKADALRAWAEQHADVTGIINYRLLSPNLATAGMPLPEQLPLLAVQGYRAVINLARPDSPGAILDEAERLRALGMEHIPIPVIWEAPTAQNLRDFYAAMDALRGQPVFVHCVLNMRVSAFCYRYRVQRLGVPEPQAREDLLAIWDPDEVWEAFLANNPG